VRLSSALLSGQFNPMKTLKLEKKASTRTINSIEFHIGCVVVKKCKPEHAGAATGEFA
jgi:hypothetical protein